MDSGEEKKNYLEERTVELKARRRKVQSTFYVAMFFR